MAVPGLTNYNSQSTNINCVECGSPIKRWALLPWAKCNTCGKPACSRHIGFSFNADKWNCSKCRDAQSQWQQSQTPQQATQQPQASTSLNMAESLYKDKKHIEAQTITNNIFYDLMLPDKDQ